MVTFVVHREDGTAVLDDALAMEDAVVEERAGEELGYAVAELVVDAHAGR